MYLAFVGQGQVGVTEQSSVLANGATLRPTVENNLAVCVCVRVGVCVCVWKRLYMATDSASLLFALAKDSRRCCAAFVHSRRGCANISLLPHRERRHFSLLAGEAQGAQARLGYLCQRSYSKMGEGWSDQPPVPASMASPKHP